MHLTSCHHTGDISDDLHLVGEDFGASQYMTYLQIPLIKAESKHVPQDATSPIISNLIKLAKKVDYPYAMIGKYQQLTAEEDRFYVEQLASIAQPRPLKFVLTIDDRIWADNTHWTLAAILRHGFTVRIGDVPHYLIDIRGTKIVVFRRPPTLLGRTLRAAVTNANAIEERLIRGWRPPDISFTIGDLAVIGRYISASKPGIDRRYGDNQVQS